MAKPIKAKVRIQITGGSATPAGKIGQMLGPHGVNMMEFCKQVNAATVAQKGEIVPVLITVHTDRTFTFVTKTPPTTELIKKRISAKKGSSRPNVDKVGKITWKDVEDIAKIKMPDLNAVDIDQAKKIIAGSARSMGVDVVD